MATGVGIEEGGWDAVSVTDYGFVIEEMRQNVLNAPGRFQNISEREDRTDIGAEAVAHTKGKYTGAFVS